LPCAHKSMRFIRKEEGKHYYIIIIITKLLFTEVLSQQPSIHQQTRQKYTCRQQ